MNVPYGWCSNLYVVPNKIGDVRLTIDPRELKKVIRREYYPMSTIEDIATRVHGSKMFSTIDVNMGYFKLVLHDNSHPLTSFTTRFGRSSYKRLPMGICAAPELYNGLCQSYLVT